jgi:hypothetical protein
LKVGNFQQAQRSFDHRVLLRGIQRGIEGVAMPERDEKPARRSNPFGDMAQQLNHDGRNSLSL